MLESLQRVGTIRCSLQRVSPSCARMLRRCSTSLAVVRVGYLASRHLSRPAIKQLPRLDAGMVVCSFVAISEYCSHRSAGLDRAVSASPPVPRSVKPSNFSSPATHLISGACSSLMVLANGTELTPHSAVTRVHRFLDHAKLPCQAFGTGASGCALRVLLDTTRVPSRRDGLAERSRYHFTRSIQCKAPPRSEMVADRLFPFREPGRPRYLLESEGRCSLIA